MLFRSGLVGEVDEVRAREPRDEGAVDGEPAHAGVEDAYGHDQSALAAAMSARKREFSATKGTKSTKAANGVRDDGA